MTQRALILVDLQNDYFAGGKHTLANVDAAAANAARLLRAARDKGEVIIHVRHEFVGDAAPFFAAGSEGAKIHSAVIPRNDEPVVLKHFVNALRDTELKATLERLAVSDLTIAGAMSHMCIDAITRAASDLGYRATVIHDACATRDLTWNGIVVPAAHVHAAFMSALAFAYATVQSTDEYLALGHAD
ncbi:MAG: cysteine hydrolase family protein [Polyangiales bacterium]